MKLTVKTLRGNRFEILVHPNDSVMGVKKAIEDVQGKDNYPCGQQLLIYKGKVLKDESTLVENKVNDEGFLVVMLSKTKTATVPLPPPPAPGPSISASSPPLSEPAPAVAAAQPLVEQHNTGDVNRDPMIQQIMDVGCGNWDEQTVSLALRAADNNPERAIGYLYTTVPQSELRVGIPNSSPLNMFPQEETMSASNPESLGFLRNNPQFQALRLMVQSNPQIVQPVLDELASQNPHLLRLIQDHYQEFMQLMTEPNDDDSDADLLEPSDQDHFPHSVNVTPAEQESIERLEGLGFDRSIVVEAFLACDRNEQLAANYLLENAADYEDD